MNPVDQLLFNQIVNLQKTLQQYLHTNLDRNSLIDLITETTQKIESKMHSNEETKAPEPSKNSCVLCHADQPPLVDLDDCKVHPICLQNCDISHSTSFKEQLKVFDQKICFACSRRGAFYQCSNCKANWYHLSCFRRRGECVCEPEDVFSIQKIHTAPIVRFKIKKEQKQQQSYLIDLYEATCPTKRMKK